jgi:5-methylcytosine-specific restriction endonuclease McrA
MSRKRNLWALQKGLCFYCRVAIEFDDATLDHFVPRCLGGGSGTRNLVVACCDCNRAKGDLDPRDHGIYSARCHHPKNVMAVKRLQMLVIQRQLATF